MYHYIESGLDNIFLVNGYELDEDEALSIKNLDQLHQAIGRSICNLERRLTGKEFRFLRIELDLSQRALALQLGATDQTIARLEKEQTQMNKSYELLLRQLFLEYSSTNSKLKDLIDRISDREERQQTEIRLEQKNNKWRTAA